MAAPQCWLSLSRCRLAADRDGTMNDKANSQKNSGDGRKERLGEALRANLQKRKAQARSRRAGDAEMHRAGDAERHRASDAERQRAGDADKRPEGLPTAEKMQKD
ncbi:MAG: hypothetical protein EOS77_10940 [Mesorhizobium sp.]|nr:MAG: hypothetical protein EOS77_10940 [Mesorhizobium sp.]